MMSKSYVLCASVISLACSCVRVVAQDPVSTKARIETAITNLASADRETRTRARRFLRDLGSAGLGVLRDVLNSQELVDRVELIRRATSLARERKRVRFVRGRNLPPGFRVRWWRDGSLAIAGFASAVEFYAAGSFERMSASRLGQKVYHFDASRQGEREAYTEKNRVSVRTGRGDWKSVQSRFSQPRVTFSPDGERFVTSGYGVSIRVFSTDDAAIIDEHRVEDAGAIGALTPVFSPDGTKLAVGNRNGVTRILDAADGRVLRVLQRPQTQGLAFSPDGRSLAVSYVNGLIGIWRVADGKLLRVHASGKREVFTVSWSPDGQFLASAGHKGPVSVWSAKHSGRVATLDGGSSRVFGLAFSPDGKYLVATGNHTTRLWSVRRVGN